MTSPELENLVRIGKLKREAWSHRDFDGLVKSGSARLTDAARTELSIEGRFDLAYNAAHALALAALRHRGYRSDNRYVVFQALPHWAYRPRRGAYSPSVTNVATSPSSTKVCSMWTSVCCRISWTPHTLS